MRVWNRIVNDKAAKLSRLRLNCDYFSALLDFRCPIRFDRTMLSACISVVVGPLSPMRGRDGQKTINSVRNPSGLDPADPECEDVIAQAI
jgi:hypothetical protein